jgi:hypothetical protein
MVDVALGRTAMAWTPWISLIIRVNIEPRAPGRATSSTDRRSPSFIWMNMTPKSDSPGAPRARATGGEHAVDLGELGGDLLGLADELVGVFARGALGSEHQHRM